ncbi:MAG: bifunctional riboflavin kinase/FAD synthetase [Flavobacteriales bacterium]|nr:bifunctional riboflavin kinase/FAD synthetase [Flavobacteriales bacterium]
MKVYRNLDDFIGVKKPIVTVGTFDGVHIGHQKIITRLEEIAKQKGGESVLLTFFPHPRMVIFPENNNLKLINTLDEKIKLLESFGLDHLIILPFDKSFSRITPTEYIRDFLVSSIKVNTLVIGYDHRFGRNRQGSLELLNELAPVYGFEVEEISAQEIDEIKVSSTKIRNAILDGAIDIASDYLKHPFSIKGTVIKGNQIGRTLGYPTANISVAEQYKIIPKNGVYAIQGIIDGTVYDGMLNIGNRPTVTKDTNETIEAYFFELNKDIYDKEIEILFIKKLRDEKKHASIEDLKLQLEKDEAATKAILHV